MIVYTPKSKEWKDILNIVEELNKENKNKIKVIQATSYNNIYKIFFSVFTENKNLINYGYYKLDLNTKETNLVEMNEPEINEPEINKPEVNEPEVNGLGIKQKYQIFNYEVNQPSILNIIPNKGNKQTILNIFGINFNINNPYAYILFINLDLITEPCEIIEIINSENLKILSPKILKGPLYIQYIDTQLNKSATIFGLYENY